MGVGLVLGGMGRHGIGSLGGADWNLRAEESQQQGDPVESRFHDGDFSET